MNTLGVISTTITIALILILFTLIDSIRNKRALNIYQELVWRGLVPLIICCIYILPWCFFSFDPFIFLIFIYWIFNVIFAAIVWTTEGFFINTLKLKKVDSFYYHFNFFNGEKRNGEANFFKFEEQSTTLDSLVKVIDLMKLMNKTKEQFENNKEKWEKYQKLKANYDLWKKEADKYNVTTLGFLDVSQLFFGFKRFIYIHLEPLENIIAINANCSVLEEKIEIQHRKFETIVGFAGLPEDEVSQRVEISKMILDVFISLPLLEQIPIKDSLIAKLKAINKEQKDALETHNSLDKVASRAIYGTNPPPPPKDTEMKKFIRIILIALIVFIGLIIAFMILSSLGIF